VLGAGAGIGAAANDLAVDIAAGSHPDLVTWAMVQSVDNGTWWPWPVPAQTDGVTMALAGAIPVGLTPAKQAELSQLRAAAYAEAPAALHEGIGRLRAQDLADRARPTCRYRASDDPLVKTADWFTARLAVVTNRSQADVVDALTRVPADQTVDVAAAVVFQARAQGLRIDDATRTRAVQAGADAMRHVDAILPVLAVLRRNQNTPLAGRYPYLGHVLPDLADGRAGQDVLDAGVGAVTRGGWCGTRATAFTWTARTTRSICAWPSNKPWPGRPPTTQGSHHQRTPPDRPADRRTGARRTWLCQKRPLSTRGRDGQL
jgi:hypothetical protein